MRCFKEGFLKLVYEEKILGKDEERMLYKDFLSLSFPVTKVIKVIEKEYGEELDQDKFIEETRKVSKAMVKSTKNKAFILICKKILNLNDFGKVQLHPYIWELLNEFVQEY